MVQTILLLPALFLSAALVSGNNLAACMGAAVGARMIDRRAATIMGIFGYVLGLLLLGENMVRSAHALFPDGLGADLASEVLLSTVAVFVLGSLLRVPLSVTSALTGMLTGISVAKGLPIDLQFLGYIIMVWMAVPILSIMIAYFSMRLISRSGPRDVWKRTERYKLLVVAASFLTAVAVGANSLALVVAVSGFESAQTLVAIAAIVFGSFFLSSRQMKRVGSEMYLIGYSSAFVTSATSTFMIFFASANGVPLSSTQTLSAAIFGAGLSHKERFIAVRPFVMIVLGWIIAPLVSFLVGLAL
jgi:PiT family inorganic phosphate transporter